MCDYRCVYVMCWLGRDPLVSHRTTGCPLSTAVINQPLIIELCGERYTHGTKCTHMGIQAMHLHTHTHTRTDTAQAPPYIPQTYKPLASIWDCGGEGHRGQR